jgi:DNA-binding CsgD family transcriptional regulator/PAS domain-containing protein
MGSTDTIGSIADLFHEAALEPGLWQAALERLGKALSESAVNLISYGHSTGFAVIGQVGFDIGQMTKVIAEHSCPRSNRWIQVVQETASGELVRPRDFMSQLELEDDQIYRKFVRWHGYDDGVASALDRSVDSFSTLSTFRMKHYQRPELSFLRLCLPAVRRALQVARHVGNLTNELERSHAVMDAIRIGIVLTNAVGSIIDMNAAAKAILDKRDGLRVAPGGKLSADVGSETVRIERCILASATAAGRSLKGARGVDGTSPVAGAVRVSRRSGSEPLSLLIAPLRTEKFFGVPGFGAKASVVIFVSDPDRRPQTPIRMLADAHGLTLTEATLLSHLLAGHDLRQAAELMSVTMSTAKTLLQRSFDRTGTRRQAQLMALVLQGPLGTARFPG